VTSKLAVSRSRPSVPYGANLFFALGAMLSGIKAEPRPFSLQAEANVMRPVPKFWHYKNVNNVISVFYIAPEVSVLLSTD